LSNNFHFLWRKFTFFWDFVSLLWWNKSKRNFTHWNMAMIITKKTTSLNIMNMGGTQKHSNSFFFSYKKIFQSNFNLLALPLKLFFKFISSQIKTQNPNSNSNVPNLFMSFSKILTSFYHFLFINLLNFLV